eukprot:scaffold89191_cov33-Tisochrysis_lutea.AAC.2
MIAGSCVDRVLCGATTSASVWMRHTANDSLTGEKSTKVARPIPRESASIPTTPEPEKRSRVAADSRRIPVGYNIEKRASRTRDIIGRIRPAVEAHALASPCPASVPAVACPTRHLPAPLAVVCHADHARHHCLRRFRSQMYAARPSAGGASGHTP